MKTTADPREAYFCQEPNNPGTVANEPKEAFPYQAPNDLIREKYRHIFAIRQAIDDRPLKLFFDKAVAMIALFVASPIFLLLKMAYLLEGLMIPENKGPMFFSYNAVSRGKIFPKYKIRLIKIAYIDPQGAARGDWHAYSAEWTQASRTYVGSFVKKFYLDELPQFYNILCGQMSVVGPRPLAVHHYQRDLRQGNVTRLLIKGGLLGLGHINKGTPEMGNPLHEYKYVDKYITLSALRLFWFDLQIIARGIVVVLKGKGL